MIELKILVDDIDYNSLTELLVPLLAEKLEKEGKGGILGGVGIDQAVTGIENVLPVDAEAVEGEQQSFRRGFGDIYIFTTDD